MPDILDIAVVGGGIAGLVAAREAAAAGARVAHVLGPDVMGGLVANVGTLDEFSGGAVSGIDLAATLLSEATDLGALPVMENAEGLARAGDHYAIQIGDAAVRARGVVIATGGRPRMLDVPGAERLTGRGVSQCGWCDGPLYRDRPVVVVGGGNAAAQEALHLIEHAATVTLLVRGAALKAKDAYVRRIAAEPRLSVRLSTTVDAIEGADAVSGVRLRQADGATVPLATDAVFVFIGIVPATAWLPAGLARDGRGALRTDSRLETSLPSVCAIGAVRSGFPGQLDDAIEEARRAVDHLLRSPA